MAWLMAYDIADPRRWRKVYRMANEYGFRLQYSLYWMPIGLQEQRQVERSLISIIDLLHDDIRFYAFPDNAWAWLSGPCPWTEGVQHSFSRRFDKLWHGTRQHDLSGLPL